MWLLSVAQLLTFLAPGGSADPSEAVPPGQPEPIQTRQTYFAIPFEKLFQTGGVFVLDEFDAAIHPELIKGILALFNDSELNKAGAQLIFTTHNPIYLNNKIFRRDQIRFVEKDTDSYESVIYSLADFGSEEVRNDHNFLINYFKGNYGALPFINFANLVRQNHVGEGGNGEL